MTIKIAIKIAIQNTNSTIGPRRAVPVRICQIRKAHRTGCPTAALAARRVGRDRKAVPRPTRDLSPAYRGVSEKGQADRLPWFDRSGRENAVLQLGQIEGNALRLAGPFDCSDRTSVSLSMTAASRWAAPGRAATKPPPARER